MVVFVDFKVILGTKGEEILVDKDDYETLNKFKWNCYGGYARTFRRRKSEDNKLRSELLHRIILNLPKEKSVDHINGNKLDNRRCNLRLASPKENNRNSGKVKRKCTSSYKGVVFHSRDERWQAQIRIDGKRLYLGYFNDEIEAAKEYDKYAKIHHKEFARLNFP